jgi:hypothetical protein
MLDQVGNIEILSISNAIISMRMIKSRCLNWTPCQISTGNDIGKSVKRASLFETVGYELAKKQQAICTKSPTSDCLPWDRGLSVGKKLVMQ